MAEELKDKITHALLAATGSNANVQINQSEGGRYVGYVLWSGFAGRSPSERQDQIWKSLESELSALERTKISFIITDTAEEYASIKNARDDGAS